MIGSRLRVGGKQFNISAGMGGCNAACERLNTSVCQDGVAYERPGLH